MFERFTRPARDAVTAAQTHATDLGHDRIGDDHLLLAISSGADSPAARALTEAGVDTAGLRAEIERAHGRLGEEDAEALSSLGIDLDAVRSRVEAVFGDGALDAGKPRRRFGGHIPFTKDAKKVLELALREAIRLDDRTIGTEHILLGILRAGGEGHAALRALGVDAAALRRTLERGEAA
ncbi:ATP-dependent Clp protease ATP-binding subunit ClpA [Nocardioides luteus]|uniref:Clp protease n=1 Tax=Nocardioides luteus TaxID=1844 RepID=A0ABQ5SUF3_9ACTN|nr:ATP-dependent Clp protease ATP-binding subunit ClpA [Nocardioides luteus]GGR50202.1 Clp protease [Nocardioides luteus]GLJ67444.1 Clp protease [Nocardioides luteus]